MRENITNFNMQPTKNVFILPHPHMFHETLWQKTVGVGDFNQNRPFKCRICYCQCFLEDVTIGPKPLFILQEEQSKYNKFTCFTSPIKAAFMFHNKPITDSPAPL